MHAAQPDLTMPADDQARLAAETFRMLADPTRVKLLWALLQGESSVNCLAELAGVSATSVSQHLAKLRLAGLVHARREGTFIYYTAANAHVQALLTQAPSHADHADGDLGAESEHEHPLKPTPASITRGS
ncbi:ArsR/SmtB family transcription factor [Mariniluteicoccus flavus]